MMRAGGKSVGCRLLRGREGCPKQSQASCKAPQPGMAQGHLALSAGLLFVGSFMLGSALWS